jgi:erythromycin esterase-like protein
MTVNPGLAGSYEAVHHQIFQALAASDKEEKKGHCVVFRSNNPDVATHKSAIDALMTSRLERYIGVQYIKRTERQSHYIRSTLPRQFDYVLHLDETCYVQPLDE